MKGVRLSGPQLQISPVEKDLERGNPLLVSDLATDGMGLTADLKPWLKLLLVSLGISQKRIVDEATPSMPLQA